MDYIIRKAAESDAEKIDKVIKESFKLYRNELDANISVVALSETVPQVAADIQKHRVFVAEASGEILGSIRYMRLSDKLAYVYRFGVSPDISNTGIGSDLLNAVIEECTSLGFAAIALHSNSKYYKLARYYYGKQFYVHSTSFDKGYIRALFLKELTNEKYDISPAMKL